MVLDGTEERFTGNSELGWVLGIDKVGKAASLLKPAPFCLVSTYVPKFLPSPPSPESWFEVGIANIIGS